MDYKSRTIGARNPLRFLCDGNPDVERFLKKQAVRKHIAIFAIVALFNNELNKNAHMIFTVHDINLMDCKRMFRKEQIWFVHKDEEGVYVYSLADFTAQKGVRDTTDIMEKYRKGALGALSDPELINALLSINGNINGEGLFICIDAVR